MRQRPDFIVKTDSTEPLYEEALETRSSTSSRRSPVDLTNAETVEFLMPIPDLDGMVREIATIEDAGAGEVSVRLPQGIPDGDYDAEFRVDYADGETLFYPEHRNVRVAVRAGTDRELNPADLSDPDASVTTLSADRLASNTEDYIGVDDPVGSSSDPVPSGHYETLSTEEGLTKSEPIVHVDAHGAEGDGVTDDTNSIQSAIDTAPDGAQVWLSSSGTYRLTDTVSIANRSKISIASNGATIEWDGGDSKIFHITNSDNIAFDGVTIEDDELCEVALYFGEIDNPNAGCNRIRIRDCTFNSIGNGSGGSSGNAITFRNSITNAIVRECTFEDISRSAVWSYNNVSGVRVRDCDFHGWMQRTDLSDGCIDSYGYANSNFVVEGNRFDTKTTVSSGGRQCPVRFESIDGGTVRDNYVNIRSTDFANFVRVLQRSDSIVPDGITIVNNHLDVREDISCPYRFEECRNATIRGGKTAFHGSASLTQDREIEFVGSGYERLTIEDYEMGYPIWVGADVAAEDGTIIRVSGCEFNGLNDRALWGSSSANPEWISVTETEIEVTGGDPGLDFTGPAADNWTVTNSKIAGSPALENTSEAEVESNNITTDI